MTPLHMVSVRDLNFVRFHQANVYLLYIDFYQNNFQEINCSSWYFLSRIVMDCP